MKAAVDEGKEISPMFPRLHVKDAEKGGPKAPPRNKMALYEQFTIPSQIFASGSASLFPLPIRNCSVPSTSSHVGSSQSIQFCTSSAPSILSQRIQAYNSRNINLIKLMQDNFINSKNSLKTFDVENSCCNLIQNVKDEDKPAELKGISLFGKNANSPATLELKSAQYGKNQMEEHSEMSRTGKKAEEGNAYTLDSFDDMADASIISLEKVRNSKPVMKECRSSKEETASTSADSSKTLQGSISQTHEEDKINHKMEKSAASDFRKFSDGLQIGRRYFMGKRGRNKDEETYRHYDALNKPSSECTLGTDISPDSVLGVMGEKQFWKARRTIINQQRIFVLQVFELHRLIKVQRMIAESPHLLVDDSYLLNKPLLKTSAFKKLQADCSSEQQSSIVEKPTTREHAKNNAIGKILLPCVNNVSKGQASNYGHHPAPADMNSREGVYPAPGNQWLVPVMSPSEGLVYKPMIGPCPPNAAGLVAPVYGACGTMNFSPGSHQRIGILSGSFLPVPVPVPPFMHPAVEHTGQSNTPDPENHHSAGEVNSSVLYQSSSSQTSQAMSRTVTTYQSFKDKESTATSPSKRVKGDVLPLFPVAPDRIRNTHQPRPRVIKAMPHNPKSATESAARIFRSIQEERKHL